MKATLTITETPLGFDLEIECPDGTEDSAAWALAQWLMRKAREWETEEGN